MADTALSYTEATSKEAAWYPPFMDSNIIKLAGLVVVGGVCLVDIARFALYIHLGWSTKHFTFYSYSALRKLAYAWNQKEEELMGSLGGMPPDAVAKILDFIFDAVDKYENSAVLR